MKWISVKERLPDDNGRMQKFIVQTDQVTVSNGILMAFYDADKKAFIPETKHDNITHWMELPEPADEYKIMRKKRAAKPNHCATCGGAFYWDDNYCTCAAGKEQLRQWDEAEYEL